MTEELAECSCVVDTSGLHAIAGASGNLQSVLFERLKSGVIGVPAWAWQEFRKLYKEEAELLEQRIGRKIQMSRTTQVGAARIAEKLDAGFPRGAYDEHVELFTASIATNNGYRVLTSIDQVKIYQKLSCHVVDIETWVTEFDG